MSKFLFNNNVFYRSIRHLSLFIFALVVFSLIVYFRSGKDDFYTAFLVTFLNALFFFAYGYITVFLLVPALLFKRLFLLFVLTFIITGFLLSFLKLFFSDFVYATTITAGSTDNAMITGWRYLIVNTKDMSFIVAVFAVAKYTKDWLYAERQKKIVESKNAEARLKLLQSQFDPHFLFNTLNNLYSLSIQKSDKTVGVIHRFKMILRYLMVDIQGDQVAMKDEIKLIKNYLYLEQMRYGDRLKIAMSIKADDCSSYISPMLFFPIIENCIKHGSSIDAGSPWIKLQFLCDNGKLALIASNSKPTNPSTSSQQVGSGLKTLKKRLEILYPGAYNFKIDELEHEYRVKLEIDLR
ncbi:sensor histidine kinase [Sunxiuqinia sp. A32]|uniref:sensor histidine kinase n=1 Tax=Sunxiuqinia sp. A32 TaxID=3461496 RepID=UPI004045C11C